MSETIRAFIAFKLPEDVIAFLGDAQNELISLGFTARWVRPENIHLTLRFLGDINGQDLESIEGAIQGAAEGRSPVSFRALGLGVFPAIRRARVIWVGIAGEVDRIADCRNALDTRLLPHGFAMDRRPYRGHLTLGRFKGKVPPERLLDAIKARSAVESAPVVADRLVLFQSDLRPSGAVYTELLSVALGSNGTRFQGSGFSVQGSG
jgi:2'-5' RNA ligase